MSLGDKTRIIRAIGRQNMSIQDISKKSKVNGEVVFYIISLYKEIFVKSKIKGQKQLMYGLSSYGLTLLPKKKEIPKSPPSSCYIAKVNHVKEILSNAKSPLTTRQIADILGKKRVDVYHFLVRNNDMFEQFGKLKKDSLWQVKQTH